MTSPAGAGRIPDPWLDRWLPLLKERCAGRHLLELGCGDGWDTGVLAAAGLSVIALDLDSGRIEGDRARLSAVEFHHRDLLAPFPLADRSVGAVVASLSLHYFPWPDTVEVVERIRAALVPGGLLLCRLNSTRDHGYGAVGHPAIGENYYLVRHRPKRFFDEPAVRLLFAQGWRCLDLQERVIARFEPPKIAWEAVLERLADAAEPTWPREGLEP